MYVYELPWQVSFPLASWDFMNFEHGVIYAAEDEFYKALATDSEVRRRRAKGQISGGAGVADLVYAPSRRREGVCVCMQDLASTERATARVMQEGPAARQTRHQARPCCGGWQRTCVLLFGACLQVLTENPGEANLFYVRAQQMMYGNVSRAPEGKGSTPGGPGPQQAHGLRASEQRVAEPNPLPTNRPRTRRPASAAAAAARAPSRWRRCADVIAALPLASPCRTSTPATSRCGSSWRTSPTSTLSLS